MTRKLFGTDGVRGVFGDALTEDLARRLGYAAARHIAGGHPRALIIRDTRESGPALEQALAEGRPPRYDGRWRDRAADEAPEGVHLARRVVKDPEDDVGVAPALGRAIEAKCSSAVCCRRPRLHC